MPSQASRAGGFATGEGNSSGGIGVSVGVVAGGTNVAVAVSVSSKTVAVGDAISCFMGTASSRRVDVLCAAQAAMKRIERIVVSFRIGFISASNLNSRLVLREGL